MPYAVVQDVPASWEHYSAVGEPAPQGLILHVAGPTDEGFRTIDVWETRDAWERFRRNDPAAALQNVTLAPPTLRELDAVAIAGACQPKEGQ
jgi:hypothetical protein